MFHKRSASDMKPADHVHRHWNRSRSAHDIMTHGTETQWTKVGLALNHSTKDRRAEDTSDVQRYDSITCTSSITVTVSSPKPLVGPAFTHTEVEAPPPKERKKKLLERLFAKKIRSAALPSATRDFVRPPPRAKSALSRKPELEDYMAPQDMVPSIQKQTSRQELFRNPFPEKPVQASRTVNTPQTNIPVTRPAQDNTLLSPTQDQGLIFHGHHTKPKPPPKHTSSSRPPVSRRLAFRESDLPEASGRFPVSLSARQPSLRSRRQIHLAHLKLGEGTPHSVHKQRKHTTTPKVRPRSQVMAQRSKSRSSSRIATQSRVHRRIAPKRMPTMEVPDQGPVSQNHGPTTAAGGYSGDTSVDQNGPPVPPKLTQTVIALPPRKSSLANANELERNSIVSIAEINTARKLSLSQGGQPVIPIVLPIRAATTQVKLVQVKKHADGGHKQSETLKNHVGKSFVIEVA